MKYFLSALVLLCSMAEAQKPFSLSGTVNGAQNGIMYFSYPGAKMDRVNDSAVLQNGKFRFTGKIDHPVMAYISLNNRRAGMDDPNAFSFFIDPADLKITLTLNAFSDAVVKGGKTQAEYAVLQQEQEKFRKRWKIVMDTLSAINKRSNFLFQETKSWALSPYNEEEDEVRANYIRKHPGSYVTAWLLRFERGISTDSLKKIYNGFSAAVKASSYGKDVAKDLEKRKTGIPGVAAALFSSEGIDGKVVSLADYRGKYVLLDFWASWCVPCRKGNPHLKELYARYKERGFEVVGVASDDGKPELWKRAVEQDGLPWKQVMRGYKAGGAVQPNDINDKYNIHSLPTQILIDPKGMIIGRYGDELGESHEALDKKLEEIFK